MLGASSPCICGAQTVAYMMNIFNQIRDDKILENLTGIRIAWSHLYNCMTVKNTICQILQQSIKTCFNLLLELNVSDEIKFQI